MQCCVSKETWVACDAEGKIIEVILAEPNRRKGDGSIRLPYIGVSKDKRQRGIFGTLIKKVMAKGALLTASVLHGNQSGMADRLVRLGFTNWIRMQRRRGWNGSLKGSEGAGGTACAKASRRAPATHEAPPNASRRSTFPKTPWRTRSIWPCA